MQSAFKFSLFAHPCPFFCYSIRLVRAENAENSVTKYTSVIHDHDCYSTVIEKVNLHDIITVQGFGVGGGGGGEGVCMGRGDYAGMGYIFHGSGFFPRFR